MTNNFQDQTGAEIPQDGIPSVSVKQNIEKETIEPVSEVHEIDSVEEQEEIETSVEDDVEEEMETPAVDEIEEKIEAPPVEDNVEEEMETSAVDEIEEEMEAPVEDVIQEEMETSAEDDQWDDHPVYDHVTDIDFSGFSRKEMVEHLRKLLENGNMDTIRNDIDALKFQFFRKLKAEVELQRALYIENGGLADNYVFEEDEYELILKNLLNKYREIRNALNDQQEAEKLVNLEKKHKIIEELKELTNSTESIGATFQQFRDLQNRWRAIGLVPQSEVKNLWDTYHHFVELFYDYIKLNRDLRDLDFKRNMETKIELCVKAESLLLETSVVKSFHTLQTLHDQWREIGPVPQEMRKEIWERFKAISSQINKKHQDYFDNLKETHNKNKEAKEALCAQVEEISRRHMNSSNQWRKNAQEIVEIQKLWNTIGSASKKDNHKLFKRFHLLCDRFFSLKREFTGQEREEQENNLQLKEDLCVQAEAIKNSNEWKATTEEFILLQNKWKEIGAVPPKYRESIWKRFRKACDYFFEQKSKHYSSIDTEYDQNLKAKQALIVQIKNFVQSKNPAESFERLKEFQRQWTEIGYVPMKFKKKIQDEYRDAINKQFDALRVDDGERNRMRYKNKIETMVSTPKSRGKIDSERDRLMRKYQQLQSDLVVWENNIGFFSKSKGSAAMISNVERMIEQGKAEMKELEEKIRIIDSVE